MKISHSLRPRVLISLLLLVLLLVLAVVLSACNEDEIAGAVAEYTAETTAESTTESAAETTAEATAEITASETTEGTTGETTEENTTETPCEHVPTIGLPAVAATCTQEGHTDRIVCSLCGVVLEEETSIPKTSHREGHFMRLVTDGDTVRQEAVTACADCGEAMGNTQNVDLPILAITGSLEGISKENKVKVSVNYYDQTRGDFACDATLKWQGGSSIAYPKKNYSIQFLKPDGKKYKVELFEGMGKQSKYCLKANWVDYSQARNVVSGQLYTQIAHSRNLGDEIDALPNGGVVNGYPIVIYLNGEFLGLYTLNIPKDEWMFGMDDETLRQAIFMGNDWTDAVALRDYANYGFTSGIELEYCSTEDDETIGTYWAVDSWNDMMRFIRTHDGADFRSGIEDYVSVERAIDTMLYTIFILGEDNTAKNIVWATYDGVHWIPSVYDMDGTWGMRWEGRTWLSPTGSEIESLAGQNALWNKLYANYYDEIVARYTELRQGILSIENIENAFTAFFDQIPDAVREAEVYKWPGVPSQDTNDLEQILTFAAARAAYLDECFGI